MGKRVLLPVDGSDQAHDAAELAFELFPDGTLVLIHVINPADAGFSAEATIPSFPEGWYEQEKERAESLFEEIDDLAADHEIDTEHVVELGRPARTIVSYVDEEDIDHVVMGSHGRKGVSRILLGSVAESVVRRSSAPVTVVR